MQASAPDLVDLRGESPATLALYGADVHAPSFARNCLLARRLVERGVRFVQVIAADWDHHGNLHEGLPAMCRETDRASAALVKDLKQRGLLESTLVVWAGEFGRSNVVQVQPKGPVGRDHHIDAFTIWMAGGGVRAGQTLGATDEIGFNAVEDAVHVHDLQATILHLLGLDHLKLTYHVQGRDFRLTDVGGRVVARLVG
jgi:arylsulfatase A-like enzyme